MSDGAIQIVDGKVLIAGGKVATADECCCCPCSSCLENDDGDDYAQDDITVTMNAVGCPGTKCDVAGVYTLTEAGWSEADVTCYWEYSGPAGFYDDNFKLILSYNKDDETWDVRLYTKDAGVWWVVYEAEDVSGLSCNSETHKLEGSVTGIPGNLWILPAPMHDCRGCTIDLEIGA